MRKSQLALLKYDTILCLFQWKWEINFKISFLVFTTIYFIVSYIWLASPILHMVCLSHPLPTSALCFGLSFIETSKDLHLQKEFKSTHFGLQARTWLPDEGVSDFFFDFITLWINIDHYIEHLLTKHGHFVIHYK